MCQKWYATTFESLSKIRVSVGVPVTTASKKGAIPVKPSQYVEWTLNFSLRYRFTKSHLYTTYK